VDGSEPAEDARAAPAEWERRFAARAERLRVDRERPPTPQDPGREQRHAEYRARQARLERDLERAAREAAEYERAEAERLRAAQPPTAPTRTAPALVRRSRAAVEAEIIALARRGEVERAGWIVRRWALDHTDDREFHRRLDALLVDPTRIGRVPPRPVRAGAFLGCGTRFVRSRTRGRRDPRIELKCAAVLGVPVLPLRAGVRVGGALSPVVPLPPAARRARTAVPLVALALLCGVLAVLLGGGSEPAVHVLRGLTATGAVLAVGLVIAMMVTLRRMGRAYDWLKARGGL
jgi:hypothetical protein